MTNDTNTIQQPTTKPVETQPQKRNDKTEKADANKRPKLRFIPIWARLLLVLVLLCLTVIIGTMIGYSVFGDGKALDVFKPSVWRHIFDIMNGKLAE